MAEPYYQDEHVTLYHGDCREVLAVMPDQSVDAVITDPPYSERTHKQARANIGNKMSDGVREGITTFHAASADDLRIALEQMGRITRSWVVATLDYSHAFQCEVAPPPGLSMKRIGVWVKPYPMPQITGDRPAQGWEAIAYFHRDQVRPSWNGRGAHGNYVIDIDRPPIHPTAKPLAMVQDMVRRFTNHGGTVLDPFAGSGTTLRAAVNEGRKAIGVEMDERYCEIIATRLSQAVLDLSA